MLATANFKRRQFSFAVAALALVLGLSSCTTQPPSQTGDGWLAPGCYSNSSGAPADVAGMDIRYLGPPTTRFNIELRAERSSSGAWDFSADGTCTGSMVVRASLVRASSIEAAAEICTDFGHNPYAEPMNMADGGYSMPVDAWGCVLRVDEVPI